MENLEKEIVEEETEETFDLDEVINRVTALHNSTKNNLPFAQADFDAVCDEYGDYSLSILELVALGLKTKNNNNLCSLSNSILLCKNAYEIYDLLQNALAATKKEIYLTELVTVLKDITTKKDTVKE